MRNGEQVSGAEVDPAISADQYAEMQASGDTWWFTYFLQADHDEIECLRATYAEHVPMAGIAFEDQEDGTTALKIEAPLGDDLARTMMFATQMLHAGLDHADLDPSIVVGATLFEQPGDAPWANSRTLPLTTTTAPGHACQHPRQILR